VNFKYFSWIIIFFISISLSSCGDLIEPSIKNSKVNLEAPANNYQSTQYAVNFWWDEVSDALKYRLQIVTSRFDSVGSLVIDTLVKKNTFTLTLNPGKYQWRIRAENGSSQTDYTTPRSFTVLQSSIKPQSVQLYSPASNILTNQNSLTFQWASIYGATKYRLEIDTNSFVNESKALYNQVFPAQQFTYILPKDQVYQWRVRAENDTAQSQWSAVNIINYNHTPPAVVNLSAPTSNQTLALPISLQWNTAPKAVKYKVYVLKSDSTTLYNSTFPVTVSSPVYSFNLGTSGDKLYWKVTAIDAYGNESQPSIMRNFTLQ
jgi:hypothetical protein